MASSNCMYLLVYQWGSGEGGGGLEPTGYTKYQTVHTYETIMQGNSVM